MKPPVPVRRLPGQGGAPGAVARLPPIKRRPELPAFKAAPDPINEKSYPGDPEGDAAVELDQVKAGFRDRMKAEQARFGESTDGGYYFVVCFENSAQATAFLQANGMAKEQTGGGDLFVDGRAFADRLGIELPAANVKYNPAPRIDRDMARLVRKPGE